MSDCCTPRGYRWAFSERNAAAAAKRYRKKGLDRVSQRIVEALVEGGVEGKSVLEVGGGIGAVQIELLRHGASRAVSLELTPTYEETAAALLDEAGLTGRVERRVGDLTLAGADLEGADIVVMNRVVCCYPDMPRLVGAAAERTLGLLVMSFPKRRWWTRLLLGSMNLALAVGRREFRIFLHRPESIRRAAESHGLRERLDRRGALWEVEALERLPAGA